MRLQVKGKNVEVSPAIRSYAEEKLRKLERQLADPTRVELELAVERNPSIADKVVAEATIWTKGPVLRAQERSTDMRASIDLLTDKLERQVTRYRQKRRRHGHHAADRNGAGQIGTEGAMPMAIDEEGGPAIVKTKQFTVHPMSAEEAVNQLELIGHDFFVFRHEESDEINVVYRRRDGGYGLIEPS
jgi:putative sigma-54 modulation protein